MPLPPISTLCYNYGGPGEIISLPDRLGPGGVRGGAPVCHHSDTFTKGKFYQL